MRVLLITDWNAGQGGAEAYITELRDGLRAAGDEVRLLTSSAGSAGDGSADYVAYGTERFAAQVVLQIYNPFAVESVRKAVRAFLPDVVFVNMFAHHLSPGIFLALRSVATVLAVTDYKCVCPIGSKLLPDGTLCTVRAGWVCCRTGCVNAAHWLRDRPRYALLRMAVRQADRVVTCSQWLQRELAANSIPSEVVTWPVFRVGSGLHRKPTASPLFIYCGRLDVEKGIGLLLRAFARVYREIPHAKLRIIGRGPERSALDRLTGTLQLNSAVTFVGWLGPEQVGEQLQTAWALVVPSLWAEPLGLVALEAMARGVPVIASASGGLGEIVKQGVSGLLFPNGDEAQLGDRMLEIARRVVFPNLELPRDVVSRVTQEHDLERHVAHIRQIFSEVAAR